MPHTVLEKQKATAEQNVGLLLVWTFSAAEFQSVSALKGHATDIGLELCSVKRIAAQHVATEITSIFNYITILINEPAL